MALDPRAQEPDGLKRIIPRTSTDKHEHSHLASTIPQTEFKIQIQRGPSSSPPITAPLGTPSITIWIGKIQRTPSTRKLSDSARPFQSAGYRTSSARHHHETFDTFSMHPFPRRREALQHISNRITKRKDHKRGRILRTFFPARMKLLERAHVIYFILDDNPEVAILVVGRDVVF